MELEETHSATVAGVLHEKLQRIPEPGDELSWSGFEFHVLDAVEDGTLRVRLTRSLSEGLYD